MNAPAPLLTIEPGLYHDVPIEVYHSGAGISKSGLDDIDRAPAAYAALHLDPDAPEPKPRGLEGNLAHCAILEPMHFATRYAAIPKDAPRRPTDAQWNAAKPSPNSIASMQWWTEFGARTAGATVIADCQRTAAMEQALQVRRKPEIAEILEVGQAEVSAYWIDEETGELCRCRPDWVHPVGDDAVILMDVKTFASASPNEFRRQVARMRYHVQDAWYSDGYALASGKRVLAFVFVVVETCWPHLASAMMLDDEAREQGRRGYRRNLNTYAECRRTGVWPGYSDRIEMIDLPRWAITED